jgi:hypothetical protein
VQCRAVARLTGAHCVIVYPRLLHDACANITAIAAGTFSTPYSILLSSSCAPFFPCVGALAATFFGSRSGGLERARRPQKTAKATETAPYE